MKLFRTSSLVYGLLLAGVLGLMWWGFGFTKRHDARDEKKAAKDERTTQNERGEKPLPRVQPPPESTLEENPPSAVRLLLMQQATANAQAQLPNATQENPIARFWFFSDSEYYVEYRRVGGGDVDRMAFFQVKNGRTERLALYGQNDSGTWEFLSGTDVLIDKPQRDLYEKDAKGNWIKVH